MPDNPVAIFLFGIGIILQIVLELIRRRNKHEETQEQQVSDTRTAEIDEGKRRDKMIADLIELSHGLLQKIDRLADKIDNSNDVRVKEVDQRKQEAKLEEDRVLMREANLNAQIQVQEAVSGNIAKLGQEVGNLKETIINSLIGLPNQLAAVAIENRTGIPAEVNQHTDKAIEPVAAQLKEFIVSQTKALELLKQATEKISAMGEKQDQLLTEVGKLVQAAQTELSTELAKPVDAAVLPGPLPPAEPPKEGTTSL